MGEEQALLGPGDAHITEAPLLLQGRRILQGAVAGEETLLHSHQIHHRKFQALAGVQGHQGDPVLVGVLAVGIAGQGSGGQEILQGALLVFLLVLERSIHQFVEVAAPVFGLIGAVGDQFGHIAALLHNPLHQFRGGDVLGAGLQAVDQLAKLQQPFGRAAA